MSSLTIYEYPLLLVKLKSYSHTVIQSYSHTEITNTQIITRFSNLQSQSQTNNNLLNEYNSNIKKFEKIYKQSMYLRTLQQIPKSLDSKINQLIVFKIESESDIVKYYLSIEILKRELIKLELFNDFEQCDLFNSFKELWKVIKTPTTTTTSN
ncbi:hypothetical protein CANARDRAFT_215039 [[Candida] arabinofermentans NRRL YB-2248]|uniref:Uncharacterized protein n=1 Tax=[Candida] arabinofermentans NRRL YB-2248 TaxID=983967 RepID=A0A1E4STT3_9ASCO|nr:hypothetical protein CANARDRAFT_215039 [[Candida] arabinofermentans NRRL YB-2248]